MPTPNRAAAKSPNSTRWRSCILRLATPWRACLGAEARNLERHTHRVITAIAEHQFQFLWHVGEQELELRILGRARVDHLAHGSRCCPRNVIDHQAQTIAAEKDAIGVLWCGGSQSDFEYRSLGVIAVETYAEDDESHTA